MRRVRFSVNHTRSSSRFTDQENNRNIDPPPSVLCYPLSSPKSTTLTHSPCLVTFQPTPGSSFPILLLVPDLTNYPNQIWKRNSSTIRQQVTYDLLNHLFIQVPETSPPPPPLSTFPLIPSPPPVPGPSFTFSLYLSILSILSSTLTLPSITFP